LASENVKNFAKKNKKFQAFLEGRSNKKDLNYFLIMPVQSKKLINIK
jgi:hypothetical protein